MPFLIVPVLGLGIAALYQVERTSASVTNDAIKLAAVGALGVAAYLFVVKGK